MSDPCVELQPAVDAALRSSSSVAAAIGGERVRIYDNPPPNTPKPYLTIGEDTVAPDLAECLDGAEVLATVHVWDLTDPPGLLRAKRIGAAVQAALLALGDLPSFRVVAAQSRLGRYAFDVDGRTAHGVITVQLSFEPL